MVTSPFKSTSRRGAATEPKAPPRTAASRYRSHSVSAVSRKTHPPFQDKTLIPTEFSNSRDNPLFWTESSSPPDKVDSGRMIIEAASSTKLSSNSSARSARTGNGSCNSYGEQRGRSLTRSISNNNGIGRSLSRVRRRSVSAVSRGGAYESEKEQGILTSYIAQRRYETNRINDSINRTSSVKNRVNNPAEVKHAGVRTRIQATEWSEDDSNMLKLEDGFSIGSVSEAEEKTIITAFEELISEEHARKLQADLAIEEHRGQELDRIHKKTVPDPKTSDMQRSRRGRRASNERKRMSKCLTEEAMAYFDECVSLSTFDSSDFSASEDPAYSLVRASGPVGTPSLVNGCCYGQGSLVGQKQEHLKHSKDYGPTTNNCSASQFYQFSFANKRPEVVTPEEDIRSYIKNFERETRTFDKEASNAYYDAEEYRIQGHMEGVVFDRVLYNSRIESGGLLLCGGAVSSPPFAFASIM